MDTAPWSQRVNESTGTQKIGLALGSGASRGWSHIGVLRALLKAGIEPVVVCGTSVGAMVGASYVSGNLDRLEQWVLGSSRSDVLGFFSVRFERTAFVDIEKLDWFLHKFVAAENARIEDLDKMYAAVCTNLETGRETWLTEGLLAEAVKASMALPGLFPAVRNNGQWLVDGGLVDPVPVAACRALGADIVIGVNLNAGLLRKRSVKKSQTEPATDESVLGNLKKQAREYSSSLFGGDDAQDKNPGLFFTISKSIDIFQDRITRSRLAGDPADVLISPRVGDIGMLEFQRAGEAIAEGEACVQRAMNEICSLVGTR
jgi:NTE family protein